jgi:hypothetical protein
MNKIIVFSGKDFIRSRFSSLYKDKVIINDREEIRL